MKRSLYDCQLVHLLNEKIYCKKHALNKRSEDGSISALAFWRGDKLIYKICANCPDFIDMDDEESN